MKNFFKKDIDFKRKLRFSIYNDTNHEEIFFFRSNGGTVILGVILGAILFIGIVVISVSYTPLRRLIPGYPSAQTRKAIVENAIKVDSLEREIRMLDLQLTNIQLVINGQEPISFEDTYIPPSQIDSTTSVNLTNNLSREDSLLRQEVIQQEQFNIREASRTIEQLEGLHMFTPVKGIISDGYNFAAGHPYLDIAAPANSVVSSILDGTVIMATHLKETGYTIQIQHENNLISIYRHNEKLLKKVGDKVSAGTAIALVGNSGDLSYGNHLHFELWHKGVPIDPTLYIKF